MSEVHAQARTTPRIRAEIKASTASVQELALRYNVTAPTIRKWRTRDDVQDLSHRPHRLCTTLSPGEEAVVIELRKTLMLPLDDLLAVTREFVDAKVTRAALARCLTRHGVGNLRQMQAELNPGAAPVVKTFKSYEPGFVRAGPACSNTELDPISGLCDLPPVQSCPRRRSFGACDEPDGRRGGQLVFTAQAAC